MKELGRFDTALEMFVRDPVDPSMNHLKFLRGLAEQGKFGYKPYSAPRGDYLFKLQDKEIFKYAMQQADQTPDSKMRQHLAANGDY